MARRHGGRRGFAARLAAAAPVAVALVQAVHAMAAPPACPGDCDGDRAVAAAEFARAVAAVFDPTSLVGCPAADVDGNGRVTAAELLAIILAAGGAVDGCGAGASPTPSASRTATPTPTPPPTFTPTPTPVGTPRSTWVPLAPLAGGPRQEVGVAALDDRVYVIGGLTDTGQATARVEAYDIDRNAWTALASLPRALHHVGAASAGTRVYSVGGLAGLSFTPAADVSRYDPALDRWESVAPLPAARGALAVAELDGTLYAAGGSGAGGSVADHAVYDPSSGVWTLLAPLPTARNHLAAVGLDGFVYVVGGRGDGAGQNNTGELDRYDPRTDRWDVLAPLPTARSGIAAAVVNGRIVVMGGEVNNANPPTRVFPQVEAYDPATDTWVALDPMALPRHGIGAATVGTLIYVPGGATVAGFAATAHHDALRIEW